MKSIPCPPPFDISKYATECYNIAILFQVLHRLEYSRLLCHREYQNLLMIRHIRTEENDA